MKTIESAVMVKGAKDTDKKLAAMLARIEAQTARARFRQAASRKLNPTKW